MMYTFHILKHFNTVCNKSTSNLSCSYMKTIHHGIIQLKYVIAILLYSIHAKYDFEILIFYPFYNFRFPHRGINYFLMGIYKLVPLIKKDICYINS